MFFKTIRVLSKKIPLDLAIFTGLFFWGFLIYSNTFQNAFVFDDYRFIVSNPRIRDLSDFLFDRAALSDFRRLSFLTFGLNYRFGGLDVAGYHAVNIFIHIFSSFFVYVLSKNILHSRKNRMLSFGIIWFFIVLGLEFVAVRHFIFEHRLYLPMAGFAIFLSAAVFWVLRKSNARLKILVFLAVLLVYSGMTYSRNFIWKDGLTLLKDTVKKTPAPSVYNNLGMAYFLKGDLDQAATCYTKSIELNPNYSVPYHNRARVSFERREVDGLFQTWTARSLWILFFRKLITPERWSARK